MRVACERSRSVLGHSLIAHWAHTYHSGCSQIPLAGSGSNQGAVLPFPHVVSHVTTVRPLKCVQAKASWSMIQPITFMRVPWKQVLSNSNWSPHMIFITWSMLSGWDIKGVAWFWGRKLIGWKGARAGLWIHSVDDGYYLEIIYSIYTLGEYLIIRLQTFSITQTQAEVF